MPPGLYYDEAANGVDIIGLFHGHHPVFFEANNGREPLFIYLQALSVLLLGRSAFALRLTAAVVGSLTVPAIYWMVREMLPGPGQGRVLAFWSGAFLATSYWHISISRLGLRVISFPLFACLSFAFFWRAWHRLGRSTLPPWLDLVSCGALVGVSLYTYTAARFLPVLIVTVALTTVLGRTSVTKKQALFAVTIIGAVALLVFLPLGFYFVTHPGSFSSRSGSLFVFNSNVNHGRTLEDLGNSLVKTVGAFGFVADPNRRHNPAGRPAVELLLSPWLVAGLVVAAKNWRRPYLLFLFLWFAILALPSVLTTSTTGELPNYLRMLGMAPGVYILIALSFAEVGSKLHRYLRRWSVLLPLPFLLATGAGGYAAYIAARSSSELARLYLDTSYANAASLLSKYGAPGAVWVVPRSALFFGPSSLGQPTLTFLYTGQGDLGFVLADPQYAPHQLSSLVQGHRQAYLVRWNQTTQIPEGAYTQADAKHLIGFLLGKYGARLEHRDIGEASFDVYSVPSQPDYRISTGFMQQQASFGGVVKLVAADYGTTAITGQEAASELEAKSVPSGHNAWVALRWQAEQPVDRDLKATIYLVDDAGHQAGQVDDLLVGDNYPFRRVWQVGEEAGTYHILPVLPAVPPGQYNLYLGVYDAQTLKRLGVVGAPGQPTAPAYLLGRVQVTRPVALPVITPTVSLPAETVVGNGLDLLGYDLASAPVRPGQKLPLTLYLQATDAPSRVRQLRFSLRDSSDAVVYEQVDAIGGQYPASQWSPGDVVRDWHDLALPPDLPSGRYTIEVMTLSQEATPYAAPGQPVSLGSVEVRGRPRLFAPPQVQHPVRVLLGDSIALVGYDLSQDSSKPGGSLQLTLYWQALDKVSQSYTVFTHLLGPDGQVHGGHDGVPDDGQYPTDSWLPGEYVVDSHQLTVDANAPTSGDYTIEVGMYDSITGSRLSTSNPDGGATGDRILLPATITIVP